MAVVPSAVNFKAGDGRSGSTPVANEISDLQAEMNTKPVFSPASRAQRRLRHCLATTVSLPSIASMLAAAHVSRSSYYRWCRQPGFQDWLAAAASSDLHPTDLLALARLGDRAHHSTRGFAHLAAFLFAPDGLVSLSPDLAPSTTLLPRLRRHHRRLLRTLAAAQSRARASHSLTFTAPNS